MIRFEVLAEGQLKSGSLYDLSERYLSLMTDYPVKIIEAKDPRKLVEKIDARHTLWVLDERGESMRSEEFAKSLQSLADCGVPCLQFLIGGADGHSDHTRKRADKLISFGKQTWPHMLAQVMLLEQLYRAQQILKGHPYHRE